ncbi:MAG: hypothetical protein APF81_11260 [Desulfosporosinus sp. BRH_c37]|nr:MAG: hypothetical protein APF81_11260 [Desulfosporosinus sp. BRH_c37]
MLNYETLRIPTPFPVGDINCYLINNDPITLIDCGVYSTQALVSLRNQLRNFGLELGDIRQILITHAHPDHIGLASVVQNYSKAKVYLHEKEIDKAVDRAGHLKRIELHLAYYGLPEDIRNDLRDYFKWELGFGQPLENFQTIEDGHMFTFDGAKLKAILTPGHAVGHLCYFEESKGLLFSGDTMLGNITPNPVIEPISIEPYIRGQGLVDYIESLKKLRNLNINLILPGHGKPMSDIEMHFNRIANHHQERKKQIAEIILNERKITPYGIVCRLWPKLNKPVDRYLGISEVLGYIDLLKIEGKVQEQYTELSLIVFQV